MIGFGTQLLWSSLRGSFRSLLLPMVKGAALIGVGAAITWHVMEERADRQAMRALEQTLAIERLANERAQKIGAQHRKAMARLRADVAAARRATDVAGGLRDRNASGTGHTVDTEGGATGWRLSDEAGAFLRAEAERADELKAYADACHAWVTGSGLRH